MDSQWRSDRTLAIVGYAGGAALAITSAVLFLNSSKRSDSDSREALVRCAAGPGTFLCGGSF
jgi:hypothetical protein